MTRRDAVSTIPFLLLSSFLGIVTVIYQGRQITSVPHLSFTTHAALAGWIFWFYLSKAILPLRLSFIYPLWKLTSMSFYSFIPVVVLAVCFILFWRYRTGWAKSALVGFGYYFISLIPFLGFFRMAFYQHSYVADHLQYFAIIGVITVLTSYATKVYIRSDPTSFAASILFVMCTFGILTWRQAALYKSLGTIMLDTLAQNPNSFWAHNEYGVYLGHQGNLDEAALEFREAIRLNPYFAMPHNNLGYLLREQGNLDAASGELSEAIQLYPHLTLAHENLGFVLAQKKDYLGAAKQFQIALRLDPQNVADLRNFQATTSLAKSK